MIPVNVIVILFVFFGKLKGPCIRIYLSHQAVAHFSTWSFESSLLTNIVLSPELSLDNSFE